MTTTNASRATIGISGTLGTLGISDEHLELHRAARRWVDGHVVAAETKAALDRAPSEVGLPSFWPELVASRWAALHLREDVGGEGYGLGELAVVLEELGRACAPGPFLSTVITSAVLQATGTADQRTRWLPGLAEGTVIGATVIPPGDLAAVPTLEARPAADGSWSLSGEVRPVLGAGWADVLIVAARPVGADERELVWCVLDRLDPAVDATVEVEVVASTDATRPVAAIRANDVVVPADRQLRGGDVGATVAALAASLIAAESVGASAWCVETAATYARDRVQFGRPIGQFQAVKHRCAAMLLALEKSRAVAWDACRAGATDATESSDGERTIAAAVAGAVVPGAAFDVAKDCIQVLGGVGYTWDHDAHLYIKRATALRALLGGPSPWRAIVAREAMRGVRRSIAFDLPTEAEPMRDEVRSFIAATQARPKHEWTEAMADAGYLVPYWPAPWGRDASPLEQLVIDDEFDRARLRRPHLQVGAWVLPTLIAHATDEQQERWIRPTLHGRVLWCQLFSEPEAGSDLASLATRAVRDDERGGWRITGQKVWTTMAHLANWGILLARTDPGAPKHQGITCFLLDMTAPGIDIRPLRELTGAALFNEVFFDDVFIPDDCVIGAVNEGWEAARTTLANERVSMGSGSSFGPGVEAVLGLVRARGHEEDAVLLDELGDLVATGQAIAMMGLRTTMKALAGAKPGAEASVRKLVSTEHEQRVQEIGLSLFGPEAAAVDGDAAVWINGFLGNRALSIAGGTSDIQRNVVAERLLGLPKDPEPGA